MDIREKESSKKRLIDANAMRDDWLENCENEYVYDTNAVLDSTDSQPTVDAVEVVRCRECKHHYWEQEPCHGKSVHYCKLPYMRDVEVFKDFFCYYGERKEGDGNG